jgi:hypothetical protein
MGVTAGAITAVADGLTKRGMSGGPKKEKLRTTIPTRITTEVAISLIV